jgi:hypothetical protein
VTIGVLPVVDESNRNADESSKARIISTTCRYLPSGIVPTLRAAAPRHRRSLLAHPSRKLEQ